MEDVRIQSSYLGPQAQRCLRQPGCGSLLGVFHHGWYLDCGGQVLLVHAAAYGEVPFGVGIDGFEERFPYRKELEGSAVLWEDGVLTIPGANRSIILCPADESPLRPFDAAKLQWMAPLAENLLEQEGCGYLRDLLPYRQKLIQGGIPELSGDLYLTRSRDALVYFFRAANTGGEGELEAALRKMIGFGPGLTPSLDDWLVGFLYVLLRQPETALTRQLRSLVCNLAENRTNRISAVYLKAAAKGLYFETLQRAGEAHCPNDLRPVFGIGSSSGSDMLTGMLFAVFYMEYHALCKVDCGRNNRSFFS